MLGWITKLLDGKIPTFEIGLNGRPRPPQFVHIMNDTDITERDIILALAWARQWTNPSTDFPDETLRRAFGDLNAPRPAKDENVANTIAAARKLLYSTGGRNRAKRTKTGLPYYELRIGDEAAVCSAATEIAGKLSKEDVPVLPLDGCTEKRCYCWVRCITAREASMRGMSP